MKKFLLWVGAAAVAFTAYTMGAKAGRSRYREITAAVDAIWNDPRVKRARKTARKEADRAARAAEKKMKKMGVS